MRRGSFAGSALNLCWTTKEVAAAARGIGQNLVILNASNEREFDTAFATFVREQAGALVVADDAVFINGREKLVSLVADQRASSLFRPIPPTLEWRQLPSDVRRKATELMAPQVSHSNSRKCPPIAGYLAETRNSRLASNCVVGLEGLEPPARPL
jgi:hypothetical protein